VNPQHVLAGGGSPGGIYRAQRRWFPRLANIWRGWQRLLWMTEGLDNFNQLQNKCG
jgi:hypothetical protein